MSRFDGARRGRILAWTGAALAWGTALTISVLEPQSAGVNAQSATSQPSTSVVAPASQVAAMPTPPDRGLMILRFQPSTEHAPEVRTVYVQQKAPPAPSAALAQPAPAPRSSGS
jgi:hypothetical protein